MPIFTAIFLVIGVPLALVLLAVIIAGAGKIYRQAGRGKGRKK